MRLEKESDRPIEKVILPEATAALTASFQCSQCGEQVEENDRVCPKCGRTLEETVDVSDLAKKIDYYIKLLLDMPFRLATKIALGGIVLFLAFLIVHVIYVIIFGLWSWTYLLGVFICLIFICSQALFFFVLYKKQR